MKRLLVLFFMALSFYQNSFCQDILVFKNGDEQKVKITEVLPDIVKYKKWANLDGPVYTEQKANIFMVKYQNGTKDVFASQTATPPANPANPGESEKNDAVKVLEATIVNDLRSRKIDQVVKIVSVKKINGMMTNDAGPGTYTIYFDMTFEFIKDGYLVGNAFEGYWRNLNVYPIPPNLAASGQQFLYTTKKYSQGTVVILGCEVNMLKTDNGYRATGLSVKSERRGASVNSGSPGLPNDAAGSSTPNSTIASSSAEDFKKPDNKLLISNAVGSLTKTYFSGNTDIYTDKKSGAKEKSDVLFLVYYYGGTNDNIKPEYKSQIINTIKNWLEKSISITPVGLKDLKENTTFRVELILSAKLMTVSGVDAFIKTRIYVTRNEKVVADESFEKSKSLLFDSNDPSVVIDNAIKNCEKKISKVLGEYIAVQQ